MENITDADCSYANRVSKDLKKKLGEYYDLYLESHTLFLAHLFENFRNKCLEIYELDPAKVLSAPTLAW